MTRPPVELAIGKEANGARLVILHLGFGHHQLKVQAFRQEDKAEGPLDLIAALLQVDPEGNIPPGANGLFTRQSEPGGHPAGGGFQFNARDGGGDERRNQGDEHRRQGQHHHQLQQRKATATEWHGLG